ncbi:MAG TPA: DUF3626 domain-containing protein [Salmonella bongori]|uniref:DUF3626 domain-containing protein n=3 Tax=Salmonella bongori TaxID=54736 RepID=A0A248K8J5_SALBN|nr:DUF3626 domain-containing protein [Salmonella bongori]ASG54599.1 hypothetical protein LFZ56_10110 [Salmonella bongori serovar 66:z41:- str. SA19983605]ECC9750337.1 DUF3626 domain-containing protein [Salmonella bongori]EDP8561369.1 DUF3626 domain-containing protein [Salmonella bongori]EDP8605205.1 DUF3626 domain-containing protein [Salmonella bongori]EDP8647832.1 DUF3626 domain-containing protein [Salmonella bongori]
MLKPISTSDNTRPSDIASSSKDIRHAQTSLSSDIQRARNDSRELLTVTEESTATGISGGAMSKRPFDTIFCGISNEERKQVCGRLFGKQILAHIHENCQRNAAAIHEKALQRVTRECDVRSDNVALLKNMVAILQNARLTINFNASKVDFISLLKHQHYLNTYAIGSRPGDLPAYNVGRDAIETKAFELEKLTDTPYATYGNTGGFTPSFKPANRDFSPESRPVYAALDFLKGPNGGASSYGMSFFELNDNVKINCTFSPFDIYGHRFGLDSRKLSTYWHMENLISVCQSDFFGYNCFKSLVKMANGESVIPHPNYGKGYEGNYIEAHIHGEVCIFRDIKHVYISLQESPYPLVKMQEYARTINEALNRNCIILY